MAGNLKSGAAAPMASVTGSSVIDLPANENRKSNVAEIKNTDNFITKICVEVTILNLKTLI